MRLNVRCHTELLILIEVIFDLVPPLSPPVSSPAEKGALHWFGLYIE